MGARRKRPETTKGKQRPELGRGRGRSRRVPALSLHPAGVAAWLILLAGAAALVYTVRREARNEALARLDPSGRHAQGPAPRPEASRPVAAAPTLPARPGPAATAAPIDLLATGSAPRPSAAPRPAPPARAKVRPRVAIIIDDIGSDLRPIERATHIPYRLTFSIIPHLRHSRESAEIVNARGYQVMLHLPMEPINYPREDPGAGAVRSDTPLEDVRRVVLSDLAAVPHVRGVNNHMGSRVTADPSRMRAVIQALAATPYFFVDSRTSPASVAFAIARELQVPSAERAVFLDDDVERTAVRAQFRRLVEIARERGSAIAIGHPHDVTLEMLQNELPLLERAGIDVVFASELVS